MVWKPSPGWANLFIKSKAYYESELDSINQQKHELINSLNQTEQRYSVETRTIINELDILKDQIIEKKRISKAFKIQEELVNLRLNPMKQQLQELIGSKTIYEDNLQQLDEVKLQCEEEILMSNEDKIGKMMSRVDLVAEVEEYEELL